MYKTLFTGLLVIFLFPLGGSGQEYNHLWEAYLREDTRYQQTRQQIAALENEQAALMAKQDRLRRQQSWLNGWIVEMRLSGISQSLVAIVDSLEALRYRSGRIANRRAAAFHAFKTAYRNQLLQTDAAADTTSMATDRAILLARSLLAGDNHAALLPDYAAIMNELYEDASLRRLVFADLQTVLRAKITLIDSLVQERKMDLALLQRLAEFHQDLRLQEESNTDVEHPASQGTAPRSTADMYAESATSNYSFREPAPEKLAQSGGIAGSPEDPSPAEGTAGLSGTGRIIRDIRQLQDIRASYLQLLRTIREELAH